MRLNVKSKISKAYFVSLTAMCAGLYALVGLASYYGIFAIPGGVVRFWPSVFIPAVFSVAFDPLVGGIGAAIGIFISDMIVHGNALLSLIAGVPANFLCFYLIGALARRVRSRGVGYLLASFSNIIIILFSALPLLKLELLTSILPPSKINAARLAFLIYLVTCIISLLISLILGLKSDRTAILTGCCSLGLLLGSTWIGFTLWGCSRFFMLPGGLVNASAILILAWIVWTYATEIIFLVTLTPAIVKILCKARLSWYKFY